jgi:dephospho-CoA kinase
MLRIGLTGGIGAGKSTVSATLAECGGIIVDGDVIAREVVEPGTEGLAQLVEAFGEDILRPDGALNRPALAAKAFVDDEKRARLNGIVHPLVARRRQEILDAVHEDAVIVEDIPLLVETGMAPMFPLVVVVTADIETRVTRLVQQRGMDEADALARIKAQAPEEQRRAIADVLLDNSGSQGELVEKTRDLWYNRVLPLAHNIGTRQCAATVYKLVPYDPAWPDDARRIIKRIQTACGEKALRIDHVGSTAVPGMDAKDVIDIQITVAALGVADEINDALANAGYPPVAHITTDMPHTDDPAVWRKRIHCAADPGRPANIHIRVDGWPGQQFALLFRDWLAANPVVQQEYLAAKRRALSAPGHADANYADANHAWFAEAYGRAWEWAETTGWRP